MKPLRIISLGSCWLAASCLMLLAANGLRAADTTNLLTRTFKVSTNALWEVFECDDGANVRRAAPSNATPSRLLNDAVHFIFTSCGRMDFSPPKCIFYDETNGTLIVRSTEQDLYYVELGVEAMKVKPPQVAIRVRFFETSEASTVGWLTAMSATNWSGRHTRAFTEAQSKDVFRLLEQRDGVKMTGTFDATMISGRQIRVPSSPASEPSVDVRPFGHSDGRTVQMYLTANIPGAIVERCPCVITPCTCSVSERESHQYVSDLDCSTIIFSEQSYFFSVKFQKTIGQETSSKATNSMLIFVTPTIIEAASEPPKEEK